MIWLYDVLWSEALTVFGTVVTWAELIAFVTVGLALWLLGRESVLTWPVGLVPVLMYLILFWETGDLPGDTALQGLYLGLGVWGWWNWQRLRPPGHELVVRTMTSRERLILAGTGVVGLLVLWGWLIGLTSSTVPLVDSATTALTLLATYAQARKLIEAWWLWIAAFAIYVPLHLSHDLRLDAAQYVVFLILCAAGLRRWHASASASSASRRLAPTHR